MHRVKSALRVVAFLFAFAGLAKDVHADSLNLYWINGFESWFGRANVEVDGRKAGVLKAGKQLRVAVGPGPHEVRLVIPLSFQSAKQSVNVSGDQYLKLTMDLDGVIISPMTSMAMFRMNFRPVSQQEAWRMSRKRKCPRP